MYLGSRNSSWSIARLKECLRRKRGRSRLPFKKAELLERQVSPNRHLAYTLRVHPRCSSKSRCNLKKKKKSLLAQTSPGFQPLPLPFCQLPIVIGLIIWPKTTAGANITLSVNASTCFVLSLAVGDIMMRAKENTDGTALISGSGLPFSVSENW